MVFEYKFTKFQKVSSSLLIGLVNHLSWKFRYQTNSGKIQVFLSTRTFLVTAQYFILTFGYHRLVNFLTRTNILKHFYRS